MNTRASAANLVQAMKELSIEWDHARAHWRDVKSHEFEETYLEDLPNQVTKALSVMEEIDALLSKIRSDCE